MPLNSSNAVQALASEQGISPLFQQALAIVKADAIKTFWPVVSNYLTTLSQSPSLETITAQSPALIVNLQAALLEAGNDVIAGLASMIETDVQNWINAQASGQ